MRGWRPGGRTVQIQSPPVSSGQLCPLRRRCRLALRLGSGAQRGKRDPEGDPAQRLPCSLPALLLCVPRAPSAAGTDAVTRGSSGVRGGLGPAGITVRNSVVGPEEQPSLPRRSWKAEPLGPADPPWLGGWGLRRGPRCPIRTQPEHTRAREPGLQLKKESGPNGFSLSFRNLEKEIWKECAVSRRNESRTIVKYEAPGRG